MGDAGLCQLPVLTKGAPRAGGDAQASLLGTATRTDGNVEVTCASHPLYYSTPKQSPWWILCPVCVTITTNARFRSEGSWRCRASQPAQSLESFIRSWRRRDLQSDLHRFGLSD